MRPLLLIFIFGAFAGCTTTPSRSHTNVDSVAEIVAFVAMARRAWTTDGMSEYDFHRLDIRVILPESNKIRLLSVFLPTTDWPDEQMVRVGRIVGLRLKKDDLSGSEPPLFSVYSLAELQLVASNHTGEVQR